MNRIDTFRKYFPHSSMLLVAVWLLTPASGLAVVTPCPAATTLEELVSCLEDRTPDVGSGEFVLPSTTEMTDWSGVAEAMLDGTLDDTCETISLPASLAALYEISRFTDADNGESYCVLVELADAGDADKKGWGTFITNLDPRRELAIQVPHPLNEADTPQEGIGVFKESRARTFIIAGAHRRAHASHACQYTIDNDYRISDVAHHDINMFHQTTETLLDWCQAQGIDEQLRALQFHGMDDSCSGVDVYLTYGRLPGVGDGTPVAGDDLLALQDELETDNPTWTVVVPGGMPTCDHNGSLNIQGRLLNNDDDLNPDVCNDAEVGYTGNFIHAEQEPDDFRLADNWNPAVKATWPAPEVVVLIDTSGSMNWGYDGSFSVPIEERRLTLARQAAEVLLDLSSDLGGGIASAGVAEFPAHPYFPGQPVGGQELSPVLLVNDTTAGSLRAVIPALPEGKTPLLGGLETALGMLSHTGPQAIVLLSDGYHNHPAPVGINDPEVNALIDQLTDPSSPTQVYTIGFGLPTDVDHPLLEKLATETGGTFFDVTEQGFDPYAWDPGTALTMSFKMALADLLGIQVPVDPVAAIAPGETHVAQVRIHPLDRRASFLLTWSTPNAGQLGFTVQSSDGMVVSDAVAGVRRHEGDTYSIVSVDSSFLAQPDKVDESPWKLVITAGDLADLEVYQYGVLAASEIEMVAELDQASYVTGDVVTASATLTERGMPVTGLSDVLVTVSGPDSGLGNWFVEYPISGRDLDQMPDESPEGEPLSLADRKVRALAVQGVPLPGRVELAALQLYDDGTHGDDQADDGTYTNQFSDSMVEGSYDFYFRAVRPVQTDDDGYPFERERLRTRYVSVGVEPAYLGYEVRRVDAGTPGRQAVEIYLTPQDVFGNYLSPGHAGTVEVDSTEPLAAEEVADNADGTYTVYLEFAGSVDPRAVDLTVEIKGAQVSFNLGQELGK